MKPRNAPGLLAAAGLAVASACGAPPATRPQYPTPSAAGTAAASPPASVWRRLAPDPNPRTEVVASVLGSSIYIIGGLASPGQNLKTVDIYHSGEDRWERGPDLPITLNHAMAAAYGGSVYVMGGYSGPGISEPTARAFQLKGESWTEIAPLPQPRAAGGAAVLDGRIYVVGGVAGALLKTTAVLDPATGRWSQAPGLSVPREHLAVASDGQRVYAVGGRISGQGNLAVVEAFDPREGRWLRLASISSPRGAMGAAATSNGFIVAPGGEPAGEGGGTFSTVEAYQPASARWRILEPLPTPRHGLGVAAIGTTLFAIAGGPEPGLHYSGANEALDLGS